ncbi:phage portal protein [Leuconostoc citreum]|uniref:phage portal protein n=1 Tax=Leuconostoc citreum TaxID=33964 RepID=UPI00200B4569|nr:phage portal protein [Leuconostoc citreum]MCK8606160.1 phage portal protein [Leuconostoc citreum]
MSFRDLFKRATTQPPKTMGVVVGRMFNNSILPTGILNGSSAMTNSDIYSVVALVSSDIASMQFHSNPVLDVALNSPSPTINQFSFWQSVIAKMLLYGNSYVLINKDNTGVVTGFESLDDGQVMSVAISDDGQGLTYLVQFRDTRPNMYYDSSELLHFKLITVGDNQSEHIFGKSPLISLVPEVSIQQLSNSLAESTLKNAINPYVTIKVPDAKLDREVKDGIRDSFVAQTTGENYGKPIVLDSSADLATLGVNPQVTELLNNLNFTKTQISKAFGVPDSYLNGNGDAQSNILMVQSLYKSSIERYRNAIQSELTMKLGTDVSLSERLTDDAYIAQLLLLQQNQVIAAPDTKDLLTQRGIL